jgi:hippurate hydrolase
MDQWSGTVMFVGQPAEEKGGGARAMLEDGLFERFPRPDFAVALHVDAFLPTGMVGYRGGYAMANVDSCDITLQGRGGHGSYPQGCIDPIAQAAQLIVDLQTIVSREIAPLEPAVVTVGSIHGGTKHNIIPDSCHLQLTIRSYSPEVRAHLKESIIRKARAVAESFRAPEPEINYTEGTPSLFNDERLVERLVPIFVEALNEDRVIQADRTMGGEDFSRYGFAGVPIFMYKLGSVDRERLSEYASSGATPPSLHSAKYYPDVRPTLSTGVTSMTAIVRELLPPSE